jgi:glycosyltransferase involved in cell wall biosynthesis
MILFILPQLSGGGAERVFINLVIELHQRDRSVNLVVFDKKGPLLHLIPDEIKIYDLGTKKLRKSVIPLIRFIHKHKPNVVFSTFGYINILLLAVRWALPNNTKIWLREANLPSLSLPNNPNPSLMNFLYRKFYQKSDKLVCTSNKMKNEFTSNYSVPSSIINILPNPVNVEEIKSLATPIKIFDMGGVCFVCSGRLTYQKGFDRLLLWFSKIDNHLSTLVIIGDGDLKHELMQKSVDLNIQHRVNFVGFCDNPWKWDAGADAFLLPSRWEGMPNSVLESLACGTLVIATAEAGGIAEICVNEDSDSITIAYSEEEFIKAMNNTIHIKGSIALNNLLPEIYFMKNVVNQIENWLENE